jgi:Calcineurin-like phosphoesterase
VKALAVLGAALALLVGCAGDEDGSAEPRPDAVTVLAVGDIARCDNENDDATSRLVADEPDATVLVLGDLAYDQGRKEEFDSCYDPPWGQFKDRTRPTPGNHEYEYFQQDATAYFDYFGESAGQWGLGYYSFDIGRWHVVALNSNCDAERLGGCWPGSPQERWLREDLAANTRPCTLAFWHHPRFSAGATHGSDPATDPFWRLLYDAGADLVLNGHDHNYQRFAPQTPDGGPDADRGIREFVVGTGGASLREVGEALPTTEEQSAESFGVLRLTLYDGGYDWEFVPVEGEEFTDRGSGRCH